MEDEAGAELAGDAGALLGKACAEIVVGLLFVAEAAHEAAAGPGDLRRVQRGEPLILGDARLDGSQVREPAGAAELAAAAADPVEAAGFVAHADVPHVHACRACRFDLADQRTEIDAFLGGEIHREALAVELPFDVRDLHLEVEGPDHVDRLTPDGFLIRPEFRRARDRIRPRRLHVVDLPGNREEHRRLTFW